MIFLMLNAGAVLTEKREFARNSNFFQNGQLFRKTRIIPKQDFIPEKL
jgi:hypothetical protein